jgi:O-antigen ligase
MITVGFFFVLGSIGSFDAYSSRLLTPLVPFLFVPLYTLDYGKWKIRLVLAFLILFSFVTNLAGVDAFLPEVADIEVIRSTYGNHNIFGEFLLQRGINLHWFTLFPLFIVVFLIWRKEVLNRTKMKLSATIV